MTERREASEQRRLVDRPKAALSAINRFIESYPLAAYVAVVLGVSFALYKGGQTDNHIEGVAREAKRVSERLDKQTNKTLGTLVAVQIANCRADHKFRVQYKVRGRAEKKLLDLFLSLARMQVQAGAPNAATSRNFIEEFQPLTEQIRIIPVPNCDSVGDQLREALGEGIEIPELDLPQFKSQGPIIGRPLQGGDIGADSGG